MSPQGIQGHKYQCVQLAASQRVQLPGTGHHRAGMAGEPQSGSSTQHLEVRGALNSFKEKGWRNWHGLSTRVWVWDLVFLFRTLSCPYLPQKLGTCCRQSCVSPVSVFRAPLRTHSEDL